MQPVVVNFGRRYRAALVALRDGMRANDDAMNDEPTGRHSRCPTGDDYNTLFDLVQDALRAAGIPYRDDQGGETG